METPDYIGEAGKASGICWQVRTGAWTAQELGERAQGGATFDLFTDVSISPFDRCVFGGSVWEVRAVLPRSDHRHVVLELVGAAQSSGQNTQNSFVPVYMKDRRAECSRASPTNPAVQLMLCALTFPALRLLHAFPAWIPEMP